MQATATKTTPGTKMKAPRIRLNPSTLNAVYVPHLRNFHRTQIYYGGSSSGKSNFLASRAVLDVLQGRNYLVARNVAKTLRGSCWNEVLKAIDRMKLRAYFKINQSDMYITAKNNGHQILFTGLDDVEKVKSITPAVGVLTDIWLEEGTEASRDAYMQLKKRLRGPSKHKKRFTISFNPVYVGHWIYKEFFGIWNDKETYAATDKLSILKTTYKDNRFLTKDDRDELENETDPYYRDVYTLGNWGVLGDLIFTKWSTADLSEFAKSADNLRHGLDFGFSSDPCGVVKLHFDRMRKKIYVFDEIYERGLTNTALAKLLVPFAGQHYITCDSAEQKSIVELQQLGIWALPAVKGPDSVNFGIQWLQDYEIIIDLHNCQNLKNELSTYQWAKDKDGNSIRKPIDHDNHLIDAIRYALEADALAQMASVGGRKALGI